METPPENLTARVRLHLSPRLIERAVGVLGTKDVFSQSRSWEGYAPAYDSWHDAYWKWVDQSAPAGLVERLKGLDVDRSKLPETFGAKWPCAERQKLSWLVEQTRQEHLQQWALFRLSMRGPEAKDPATYDMFFNDMRFAHQIGDSTWENPWFKELAKQKQRKPTRGVGNRRLKYHLLFCWIPGCLWASLPEGVAVFLNAHYPRSSNKQYDNKTILDARRELKLYRSPKPLGWGLAGTPPRLVPR